jgi:hypothetical protein
VALLADTRFWNYIHMNDAPDQQQSAVCHAQTEAALANYFVRFVGRLYGPLYLPHDFREPEQQQFISLKAGMTDYLTAYPNLASFWVDALFDFLVVRLASFLT